MFSFFKQKIKPDRTVKPSLALSQLNQFRIKLQKNCADKLTDYTTNRSKGWMATFLLVFVLLSGGFSSFLLFSAIKNKLSHLPAITPIDRPTFATDTDQPYVSGETPNTAVHRIINFRIYMDSLARSPGTKPIYDSIINTRPGLLDSIGLIERLYLSK